MLEDKCFTHAAAIAYYTIFSIFPLTLLLIGILGFFLEGENTQKQVFALAARYFPPGARRPIRENIAAVVAARETLSFLSIASLVWSATFMFDAISDAINLAWKIPESERFLASKIKSLSIVLLLVLAALLSTLFTTQLALLQRFQSFLLQFPWGERVWQVGDIALSAVGWMISWSLIIIAFAMAYRFLPRAQVIWRDVWLAAILAATLWEFSKRAFIWYVASFSNYRQIYGPISAVLALLFWTYLSALILIWGAEFAAEHTRSRNKRFPLILKG
jgi:membrane protein